MSFQCPAGPIYDARMTTTTLDPARTIAELKELRALTGNADGAQRVAFTPTWAIARKWFREKLERIPGVEVHTDAAGNVWATLKGKSDKALLMGGHIDSVPNGGGVRGRPNNLAPPGEVRRMPS